MQPVPNPNRKLVLIFAVVGLLGLVAVVVGLIKGAEDWGLYAMIFGGMALFMGVVMVPMLQVTGIKQIKTIEALMHGENLMAHWQFDQDEWNRYTDNEHTRGVRQARSAFLWTLGITFALVLVAVWIAGTVNATGVAIASGIAGLFAVLFGGLLYLSAKATHRHNLAGVGEVYIGPVSIYFAGRYYTWEDKTAKLTRVAFESGDPSVVEFHWEYNAGGEKSHQEVRIPVPRGREGEAQNLVAQFYWAA